MVFSEMPGQQPVQVDAGGLEAKPQFFWPWQRGREVLNELCGQPILVCTSAVNKIDRILRFLKWGGAICPGSWLHFTHAEAEEDNSLSCGVISYDKIKDCLRGPVGKGRNGGGKGRFVKAKSSVIVDPQHSGHIKVSLQRLTNPQQRVTNFLSRDPRLIYACDTRYLDHQHRPLKKAPRADMVMESIEALLAGREGDTKILALESGACLILPKQKIGFRVSLRDELEIAALTKDDLDNLGTQAGRWEGANAGIDICTLAGMGQKGKIKAVNGIEVDKLPPSWLTYLDQASKGAHMGLVTILGSIVEEGQVNPMVLGELFKTTATSQDLLRISRETWEGRDLMMVDIGNPNMGSSLGLGLRNDRFLTILQAMVAERCWLVNPADSQNFIYDPVNHDLLA